VYFIPFLVILIIALAIFFSPLLAVILLVVALLGIGGTKYFGGASVVDQENPHDVEPRVEQPPQEEESTGGIWGETWPEERDSGS
jgi:disulfide bond formation protein DsbB